jgi:outer membrane receptor protein involved in Fe transport
MKGAFCLDRLPLAAIAIGVASVLGGKAFAQASAGADNGPLEEVFVTGSRISRQGFDAPVPVTSIDSDYIESLGFVNVGAAVQQLPISKATLTPETNGFGSFNVGSQIINLRALGSGRTLTLVDGRRHIASTDTANVDLNLIPPLLLDRTEIVTGGASAAYGSDALAGVVNVILDKDLEGFRLQADYGFSNEGDGESTHISAAGGLDLFNGRGHLIVGGEYEDAKGVDTCIKTRDWCRNLPGIVSNSASATNGEPRNIITDDVRMGRMTSEGLIVGMSGNAAIPIGDPLYGIAFDAGGNPVPFEHGLYYGEYYEKGGDGFSRYETTNPRVPVKRATLFTHLNYELSDQTNVFVETSFGDTESQNLGAARWFNPPAFEIPIYRDNPFLHPDIAQIMDDNGITVFGLGKHWDDWGRVESHSDNQVARLVLGADGALSDGWTWDAYYQLGYNHRHQYLLRQSITTNHYRALDATTDGSGQPICRDLLSTDPAVVAAAAGCVPLNPFGLNQWDPAARDYVLGTLDEQIRMNEYVVAANVQGEIFEAPGGPIGVAAGLEYRRNSGAVTHDPCSLTSCYWQNYGDDFAGNLEVTEGYVETAIPLLSDKRGAKLFELDAAIRQTHYRNTQDAHIEHHNDGSTDAVPYRAGTIDATTWKFSILYDPNDWLRFRTTKSRDIRAPNFDELYSRTESLGFTGYSNPWLGTTDPALSINSGNVNLDPEDGDTQTFGIVFSPVGGWAEGLRVSIDWWDIEIHGAVGRLGGASIVEGCFLGNQVLCELITTPGGTLTEIQNSYLNLDVYRTNGVDVEAFYQVSLDGGADLGFRVFATKTDEIVTIIGDTATDYVGVTGGAGFGQPDYEVSGTVTYGNGPFNLAVQGRYIPTGIYNQNYIQPGDPGYSSASPFSINDNTVDSVLYTTLSARYTLPFTGNARSWEVFGTISNLFDEDPPIVPGGSYPTNPAFYDQVGRQYRLGIRADF